MKKTILLPMIFGLLLMGACGDDEPTGDASGCNTTFNQTALFEHIADNIIIPTYSDLQTKVNDLSTKTTDFVNNPTQTTLAAVRTSWLAAYLVWQQAAQFEFGPATEVFLRSSVNNFPLNVEKVNQNIGGTYDFNRPDEFDKGFPALDYLFYGLGNNDTELLSHYTSPAQANPLGDYVLAVVADIKQRVAHTYAGWVNDGYRATFVESTGTAAGASLSLIVNALNENYEFIKREKIGIPSGVLTLDFTNPDKVEAFYGGKSVELALAALQASERLYLGNTANGSSGIGLDDYLIEIGAMKDNETLDQVIKNQFITAINALAALPDPLSETVENDAASVVAVYNEITKQLLNIKTDMPSVLCVSITYIDNPSDGD